jgi:PrtD family type I secretion system ABC transporter
MIEANKKRAWILPVIAPFKEVMRELLVSSLTINILALITPIFTMQVYDRVIGHNSMDTLIGLTIGVLLVVAFDYILRISRGRIMQTMALKLDVEVGEMLFDKFMLIPLKYLEAKQTSSWQQLFRDVDTIRNTLSGSTALLLIDMPFLLIFLVVIFIIGKPLVLIFIVLLAAFAFLAWYSGRTLSESGSKEGAVVAGRDALMAELIAGRSIIKATGLDRVLRPRWEERQAKAIDHSIKRGAVSDGFVVIGSEVTQLGSVAMTALGAVFIINHDLSMGALVACNMLSGRLLGPIAQLVGAWRSYTGFMQSVDRLSAAFEMPEERKESAVALPRPKGDIMVEGVVFSFDEKQAPVLAIERVAFRPGGVAAILGRNGSGKTTLLKVLMGLYHPDKGRVLLDGADIAQFTRSELAHWMGYVPQECVLFNSTIRDNIALGAPGCSDEQVLAAAEAAGVHHTVVDMPNGYATQIGEAGSRLSAGQRQRIAIARALVGNPAVLLLDEPSSSLDRQAEEDLKNTLVRLAQERTVVVVTHSPVLLPSCRDIVVLEKGQLAAAGPASEILPRLMGQPAVPKPVGAPS